MHRAWRLLPRGARRAALARASEALSPRPDRSPAVAPGLAVAGELDRASGLGESARLILAGLAALDIPHWAIRPGVVPPPNVPLLVVGTAGSHAATLMRLGRGLVAGRKVIGYWFWELTVAPPAWHRAAALVHEVWAPSAFTRAALEKVAPVTRVVPVPAACRAPAPSGWSRARFGLPEEAVVTLLSFSLASSFERKNPLGAIAAHRAAFGERPDRVLMIHATEPDDFPADTARLRAACGSNVMLHTQTLARPDAEALMACSDIVLSLHRAEGFGLVPAEAMLLGKPVVATDWSSTAEFLQAEHAALVPARPVPAIDPRGVFEAPGAMWAEPDGAAAAAWLRTLADDPALRRRMGDAARRAAPALLGPAGLAEAMRTLRA